MGKYGASQKGSWHSITETLGMDYRSLALMRVGLGLSSLYDIWIRTKDLRAHYTDEGVMPRAVVLDQLWNPYWVSVYMWGGSATFIAAMFAIHAVCAAVFAAGWHTRTMTLVMLLLQNSLNNRNDPICHGGDFYMRCILFWGLFLPLGEVYSVDAALSDRHKKRRHGVLEWCVVNAGTVSLIMQIAIMYITSFFEKSAEEWYPDGSATYLALKNDFLARGMAHVLLMFPRWFLRLLTISVLYWEGLGPLLFISPWKTAFCRTISSIGFALMHLGFWSCLRLDMFGAVTMSAATCLLPTAFWDTLAHYFKSRARTTLRVHYDGSCRFCCNLHRMASTFLLIPKAELIDTRRALPDKRSYDSEFATWREPDRPSGALWTVDYGGLQRTDLEGLALMVRASPFGVRPVAWLADKVAASAWAQWLFGEFVHDHDSADDEDAEDGYTSVAVAPEALPSAADGDLSGPSRRVRVRRVHVTFRGLPKILLTIYYLGQIFCAFMGVLVFGWMWSNVKRDSVLSLQNPTLREVVLAVQMDQAWGMFAPRPQTNHWYYIMEGTLANGTQVELWGNGGVFTWEGRPMTYEKPSLYHSMRTQRWMKYHEAYNDHGANHALRLAYGRWLCRNWNRPDRHVGGTRLANFRVWLYNFAQQLDDTRKELPRQEYWRHEC